MFTKKTMLIIPTRNRINYLNSTLKFFFKNKIDFHSIVVIDSSDSNESKKKITKICNKFNTKLIFSYPSTSHQRNLGLENLNKINIDYVMFLDDDLKFNKKSFAIMNDNILKNKNFLGYCFNKIKKIKKISIAEKIKCSKIVEALGFYSVIKGYILENGWHTKIENIEDNLQTQWLPTSCSIYKKKYLHGKYFDESFGEYSYLEDLDFSLQLNPKRKNIFLVVSNAHFFHKEEIVRTSFSFGLYEFINRYKIVKKFNLKKNSFFLMAILKILITTISIFINLKNFPKLIGNCLGITLCIIRFNTK